ncbi:MAG: outer membrane lipoprotein carrier protein LolA [SAR324 cluster bacterium]|nr:outer membrane lipoprotein carrier protein LolA [SAR324 cluster bacterium]
MGSLIKVSIKNKIQQGLCFALLCSLSSPLFAFDGPFRAFEAKFVKLKTFSADFQQIYFDPLNEKEQLAQGEMAFARPSKMRLIYLEPHPLEIIIGETRIWIVDPLLENVVIQDVRRMQGLKSLNFLFKNKSIESGYTQVVPKKKLLKTEKGERLYHLTPKEADPYISEVHLKLKKGQLVSFALVAKNGGYRILKLYKNQNNPKLAPDYFSYKVPKDFETIDNLGQ